MDTQVLLVLAVALLALVSLGLWLALLLERGRASRASRARVRRALAGERDAEDLLRQSGFTVVDRQVRGAWTLRVDGQDHEVEVRADLLVERDGQRLVAEVKTGQRAPDPLYPPTRRQLLEYGLVFACDGLVLVNPETRTLVEVQFPDL